MFIDNLADNTVNLENLPSDEVVKAPDKKDLEDKGGLDLNDFFLALDQQTQGGIFDKEPTANPEPVLDINLDPVQPPKDDPEPVSEPEPSPDKVAELEEKLNRLEKQYSDSSKEAKRLYEENRELSQYRDYVPILDKMKEDPGLISHVRNYLDGNATPASVKEELNLPEEFIFDGDEAIRNPDSESGRVLGNLINKAVEQRLKQHTDYENQQRRQWESQQAQQKSLQEFKERMKMDDGAYDSFVDYAKNHTLTLDDIHYLMNRESREKMIAKNAIKEREKQLLKMQGVPPSMASDGGYHEEISEEERVFDAIQKSADAQNIFGG